MEKSLYNILGMKRKNSIFKSVVITGNKTFEGYPIIEVEPYDDTFLNAISYPKKYDETLDRIIIAVYDYFNQSDVWLSIYTEYGNQEILLSEYYMNEVFNKTNK